MWHLSATWACAQRVTDTKTGVAEGVHTDMGIHTSSKTAVAESRLAAALLRAGGSVLGILVMSRLCEPRC